MSLRTEGLDGGEGEAETEPGEESLLLCVGAGFSVGSSSALELLLSEESLLFCMGAGFSVGSSSGSELLFSSSECWKVISSQEKGFSVGGFGVGEFCVEEFSAFDTASRNCDSVVCPTVAEEDGSPGGDNENLGTSSKSYNASASASVLAL